MSDTRQLTAFEYEPLAPWDSGKYIRLLHLLPRASDGIIRCTLENNVSISEGPDLSYNCLSYEWGHKSNGTRRIEINGRCLCISRNLHGFLRSFLHNHNNAGLKALWIDAICINQADKKEKSEQVSQMHDIFRNASEVLCWLGPSANNSDALFDLFNGSNVPVDEGASDADAAKLLEPGAWSGPQHLFFDAGFRLYQAMKYLCRRTYWKRMWIIPEILLARKLRLFCGSKKTRWLPFVIIVDGLVNHYSLFTHLAWVVGDSAVGTILRYWIGRLGGYLGRGKMSEDIQTLFAKFGTFHCSESRDRLYALRSLSSDAALIHVSYESSLGDVLLKALRIFRRKMRYAEFQGLCQALGIDPWDLFKIFKGRRSQISEVKTRSSHIEDAAAVYTSFSVTLGRRSEGGLSEYRRDRLDFWYDIPETLANLSSNGRLKMCNCTECSLHWQAYGGSLMASPRSLQRLYTPQQLYAW